MNRESNIIDKKKLIIGIGIIVLAFSLGYKLPYTDRSISQVLIPVIRFENSELYLSGLLVIVTLVYGVHLIVMSGKYKNKVLVTLFLLIVGLPLMTNFFDIVTSPINAAG